MKRIKYLDMALASVLACIMGLGLVSCKDDDDTKAAVPADWISLSSTTLSIGYEGGDLELAYTLAKGLDPKAVYVVNQENWCSGYIEDGKIKAEVGLSYDIEGRTARMEVVYDESHKAEIIMEQGKAPAILVESIDLSGVPESININEELDLNEAVSVAPVNASYKTLVFTLGEGSEQIVSLSDAGVVTGLAAGVATINVATTDESGVTAKIELIVIGDIVYDRSAWTVTTFAKYANGQNYVTDGSTGKPEHILDGLQNTYLSLIKPGKSMNGYVGTTDPNFTVDTKGATTFNYFYWQHRKQNNGYLQVLSVDIYGSNDGENFTKINDEVVEIVENLYDIQYFEIPESTYRYVKAQYRSYSAGGSSAQVAEFGLGRKL